MSKAEDFAQDLEMHARNAAITAQRAKVATVTYSHCIECGIEIPPKRRSVGGVCRCVDCQDDFEKKQKRGLR